MGEPRNALRLLRAFIWVVRRLPASWARALGAGMGYVAFYTYRVRRPLVLRNLRAAYAGEKSEADIWKLARANMVHMGISMIETLRIQNLTADHVHGHDRIHGIENLKGALDKGKGVIAISGHLGSFDRLCVVCALLGYDVSVLAKDIKKEWMQQFWREMHGSKGVKLLSTKKVTFQILRALKRNSIVGMVIDQHMPGDMGIPVQFFGRPARTMKGVALLAARTGAPVVPVYTYREGGVHHYVVGEEIPLIETGSTEESLRVNTQRYTAWLEARIREHPEQWFWVHDRWKEAEQR